MAFDEVRFPDNISRGAKGGPMRRTTVVELASGDEERNSPWADSRRNYDVAYGIRRADDLATLRRRSRDHGLRTAERAQELRLRARRNPAHLKGDPGLRAGVELHRGNPRRSRRRSGEARYGLRTQSPASTGSVVLSTSA